MVSMSTRFKVLPCTCNCESLSDYVFSDGIVELGYFCCFSIAFASAVLGFYTGWLFPAAIVGTLVFIIGIFMMFDDIPA